MQFRKAFPCTPQAIWEADLVQGPVQVSKLDITDTNHRSTLQTSQVDAFTAVISSAPGDNVIIIYIGLVLLMGWVDSPTFFYAFSETLKDFAKALVDTEIPAPYYGAITKIPTTGPPPSPH